MVKRAVIGLCALGCLWPLSAQVTARRPFVRAVGEGTVSVRPDQARVTVGVTTQAPTAAEATDQNAQRTGAVLSALRGLVASSGEIRTVSVSVTPIYRTVSGQTTLTGYQASNVMEVVVNDTALAGRVIDAASAAGANNIQGVRFALRDPAPARAQALRLATQAARADAEAIAFGLGQKLGAVLAAEQGGAYVSPPLADNRGGTAAATPTPVEIGPVQVRATVTLEIELL